MPTYAEMLRDPRWQRRRLEIMERANFTCEACGDAASTLNVHHRIYRRGHKPWEYADHELICVCEKCHGHFTAATDRLKEAVVFLDVDEIAQLAGYARGLSIRRRMLFDAAFSDQPGALFDAADWDGVAAALGLRANSELCSGDTSEAAIVEAAMAARMAN